MKEHILIPWLFLLLCLPTWSYSQTCGITDTLTIPVDNTVTYDYEVTDIVNNDLADPGQGVCGIEIFFRANAVTELEIFLISPTNQEVQLIGPSVEASLIEGNLTLGTRWRISFVPCGETAEPDFPNPPQWNNQVNEFGSTGIPYTGSYYPFINCLEDFNTGPVNGTWRIDVRYFTENIDVRPNFIEEFRIIFCDDTGANCCFAEAGSINNLDPVEACEGDAALDLELEPAYTGPGPDTLVFDYTFAITRNDTLLAYDTLTDLTGFPPGVYNVCGLSYEEAQEAQLPVADGTLTLTEIRADLDSDTPSFCGEFTDECVEVTIVGPITTELEETICTGDSLFVGPDFFVATGDYTVNLTSELGCDSIVQIDLEVVNVFEIELNETICQGDSIEVGSSVYRLEGSYSDTLQTIAGCDSIVNLELVVLSLDTTNLSDTICIGSNYSIGDSTFTLAGSYAVPFIGDDGCDSLVLLDLTVIEVIAAIAEPDTITCNSPEVTLDAGPTSPNENLSYIWTTLGGDPLGTDSTVTISEPDTIILQTIYDEMGIACSDTDTVIVVANIIQPIADAGLPDTLTCDISELVIGSTNSTQGDSITYLWQTNGGNFVSDSTILMPTIGAPGTYTLFVTDTINGCSDTSSVLISIDTIAPIADAGEDLMLNCEILLDTLDGSNSSVGPEFTYSWRSINGNLIVNPDQVQAVVTTADTFVLAVTNTLNGCFNTDTVVVIIDTIPPNLSITEPELLNCSVSSIELDGSASDSTATSVISWNTYNGGNIESGGNTLTPLIDAVGDYELVIFNADNGCRDSLLISVQDTINMVIANAGQDTVITCNNTSIILDGSVSSSGPDIVYSWTTQSGNFVSDSTILNPEIDLPGVYELIALDTFTFCADTAAIVVGVDTIAPIANAGSIALINCDNPIDTLDGSGSSIGDRYAYLWSGPCIESGQDSINPIISCPGTYVLTVSNELNGCSAIDSIVVVGAFEEPTANAGPDTILTCIDTLIQLDGSLSSQGLDISYSWTGPGIVSGDTTNMPAINLPGVYELIVTNTLSLCRDTTQVTVAIDTVPPIADAGITDTITCLETIMQIGGPASSIGSEIGYQWQTTNGNIISDSSQATIDINAAGIYVLEVLDSLNGCIAVDSVQIFIDTIPPIADAGMDGNLNCRDTSIWLGGLNTSLGTTFSYQWEGDCILTNPDSSFVEVNCVGDYILTVLNTLNGCSSQDTVQISQLTDVPIASIAGDTVQINCETGVIQLDGSASSGGESSWIVNGVEVATNDLQPIVNGAGTYYLIIEDPILGCTAIDSIVVEVNCEPTIVFADPDTLTCATTSVIIDATASTSGDIYSYEWIAPADGCTVGALDTSLLEVTCPGNYTLIVTHTIFESSDTLSLFIATDTIPPIAIAIANDSLDCVTPSVTLDGSGSTGNGDLGYTWYLGETIISSSSFASAQLPGTYVLEVLQLGNGCINRDTVEVIQVEELPTTPIPEPDTLDCTIDRVNLIGSLPDPVEYSGRWCTVNENGELEDCIDALDIEVTTPGLYAFELTQIATGCSGIELVTVEADTSAPVVDAGMPDELDCTTNELVLNGTILSGEMNLNIEWTGPIGSNINDETTLTPSIDQIGVYTLIATNPINGCIGRDSVEIGLTADFPMVDAGVDTLIDCLNPEIVLDGSASASSSNLEVFWLTDGGSIQTGEETFTPLIDSGGVYYLRVTDLNNGCSGVDSVIVLDQIIDPTVSIGALDTMLSCNVSSIELDGSNSFSNLGGNLEFIWTRLDGQSIPGASSSERIEIQEAGIYQLEVQDELNGCSAITQIEIEELDDLPNAIIEAPEILGCDQESVTLNGSLSTGNNLNISWILPSGELANSSALSFEAGEPGIYQLILTDEISGCSDTTSSTIVAEVDSTIQAIIIPPPTVSCLDAVTELDGTQSSQGSQFDYIWSTSDAGEVISGQGTPTATIEGSGTYILTVINTNNGCSTSTEVVVEDESPLIVDVGFNLRSPSCTGDRDGIIQIDSITGGTGPFLYAINGEPFRPNAVFSNLPQGNYELSIEDVNGCTWNENVVLNDPEDIQVDLGIDLEIALGDTAILEAIVNRNDYDTLMWTPSSTFEDPSSLIQVVMPFKTTIYGVMVRDENGCMAEDQLTVRVITDEPIFVPNAFSPDGDGQNDVLYIFAGRDVVQVNSFQIFDRWGNNVFGEEEFQPNDPNFGWDGSFQGEKLNAGVFVFFAEVELIDGRIEMIKGDVVLLR